MLKFLVSSALRFPLLVGLLTLLVLAYGGVTVMRAKYDVFPEFVPAQADIQTEAPGLVAEQVERLVTQPLENAINGGADIEAVRSESIQGLSVINVVFKDGSDPFRDRQLLTERVNEAAVDLPQGVAAPTLGPMTSSTMDLLKVGFTSTRLSPMALRTLVEWTVRPRLLGVPGVARAAVYGGAIRELSIRVRPQAMAAAGISIDAVVAAARAAAGVRGGGYIDTPNQRVLLETQGQALSPAQLSATPITAQEGRNLTLGDVATVDWTAAPAYGDARIQGRPGVLVAMSSQYGANTLEVTDSVEAALAELMPMLKEQGVDVLPALHRPATFIERALGNMRNALLLGAALVVVVLILFLRNWRTALISFITIPLSLLVAVLVLDVLGWTINTMTLGGLAVALGVVVDDAIINVENITRRMSERPAYDPAGAALVILAATLEVYRPVVVATLVVGLVFLPVLLLPGLQGSFFAPLAASFLIATFASLFAALTVTPAFCLLLLKTGLHRQDARWLRKLKLNQRRLVSQTLPHAKGLLVGTLVVGLLTCASFFLFANELLPAFREGHFVVGLSTPAGASLEESARIGEQISREILAIPGVRTASLEVGRAAAAEDTWPPNQGEFHIELDAGLSAREEERIEAALRDILGSYPGVQSEVMTFLGDRIGESLSGETAPVAVNVYGTDLDVLDTVAAQVAAVMKKLPDAADVQIAVQPGLPTVHVKLDPSRLSALGMRPADVLDAVATAYQGDVVAQVYDGNQAVDVRVTLDHTAAQDPEAVGDLLLRTAEGRLIQLRAVADVDLGIGRSSVLHEGGRRRQVVTANPESSAVAGYAEAAKTALSEQVKLPVGTYLEFSGAAESAAAARNDLLMHAAVAALGVVILLLLVFSDRRSVALILANAPFALVGGVLAVALTGGALSIGALTGFVTLLGISARNTILLVSHYEHLVEHENAVWNRSTALRGARERLMPILMTALVTALGLLPLALGNGEAGREVEGPMAIVILGGLVTSTALNLLVMPAMAARYLRLGHRRINAA